MMQNDVECCAIVGNELQKVLSRFEALQDHSQETLENAIQSLESIGQDLLTRRDSYSDVIDDTEQHTLSDVQKGVILDMIKKVKETNKCFSNQHKDLHSSVSKVGKVIDKHFVADYAPVPKDIDEEKIQVLNEVICDHFMRYGRLGIAEAFINEAKLDLSEEGKLPFLEMHEVIEGLKMKNLGPAVSWAERNHEYLEKRNSSLEFDLHRMNFLMLLNSHTKDSRADALRYAKYFQMFSAKHTKDIQQLMGCFLFQEKGLENSPYALLLSSTAWEKLAEQFAKDACVLLGMPVESPLTVCINAGAKTLGPLIHIMKVMLQKHLPLDWGPKEELPVGVDLGHDSLFHSVFACPILRRHVGENNPPMKLQCGHVVSKDAINQLYNGQKLKCPYCPVEQTMADARRLHL